MKILFILSRFPYPLEKGDKLRAWQHICSMHRSGHEVYVAAVSDCVVKEQWLEKVQPFCKEIRVIRMNYLHVIINLAMSFFRNIPLQTGYFFSSGNAAFLAQYFSEVKPDLVYCQLIRTARLVHGWKGVAKAIDFMDAYARGTKQRSERASFLMKPLYRREVRLVKKMERECCEQFHGHWIISEQDLRSLNCTEGRVVTILPNGVDTEFYAPRGVPAVYDITFTGNMNYPPNIDAARFLVEEIMPLVWERLPEAKVQIAGANPSREVKALAGKRITITGWVDDIRDCYAKSKVFIAPMRIGTGLQNKLLEAMAMQIPAVTTPISFHPLGAKDGEHLLVGSDAPELANHLIALLSDSVNSKVLAERGRRWIIDHYSMQHSERMLQNLLMKTYNLYQNSLKTTKP